ncbi:MAG: hypothetical protein GY711_26580 [bacterium]|nr:hypothetical protein [bacterium]
MLGRLLVVLGLVLAVAGIWWTASGRAPAVAPLASPRDAARQANAPANLVEPAEGVAPTALRAREVSVPETTAVRIVTFTNLAVILRTTSGRSPREVLRDPFGFRLTVVATITEPGVLLEHDPYQGWGVGDYTRGKTEDGVEHGILALGAPLPLHVSLVLNEGVLATQLVAPGTSEVTFELTDDNLQAACGSFELTYALDDPARKLAGSIAVRVGRTHSSLPLARQGKFRRERVPPGRVKIELIANEAAPWTKEFVVAPGEHVDLGAAVLKTGTAIEGRAIRDGMPVGRVFVSHWVGEEWVRLGRTRQDGSFRIGQLPAGIRVLRVVEQLLLDKPVGPRTLQASACRVVDTRRGSDLAATLVVEPCVRVRVPARSARGVATRCRILDGGLRTVHSVQLNRKGRVLPVVAGSYFAVFLDDERELERRAFDVGNEPVRLGTAP